MSAVRTRRLVGAAAVIVVGGGLAVACGDGRRPAPYHGGQGQAVLAASPDRDAGPWRVEAGVPVGYAHNEAGAAAAATNYLATLSRLVSSDGAERAAALRRIADPSAPEVVEGGLAAYGALDRLVADARIQRPDAGVLFTDVPVAYRVEPGVGDTAQVDVWSVGLVLIQGRTEATEVWSTNRVGLTWSAGDWRVAWWTRASGPAPASARQAATPADGVLAAVGDWRGFRHDPLP